MAVNPVGNNSKTYQGSSSDAVINSIQQTVEVERAGKGAAPSGNMEDYKAEISGMNNKEDQEYYEVRDKSSIKKSIEQINKKMSNTECLFGVHEKTNRVTIKIVDKESKEILKEYPPEKTLELIAKAWEIAGILVDEKR